MIFFRTLILRALIAWADWQIDADTDEVLRRSREGSACDAWVAQTLAQIADIRARRDRHASELAAMRRPIRTTTWQRWLLG